MHLSCKSGHFAVKTYTLGVVVYLLLRAYGKADEDTEPWWSPEVCVVPNTNIRVCILSGGRLPSPTPCMTHRFIFHQLERKVLPLPTVRFTGKMVSTLLSHLEPEQRVCVDH